LTLLVGWEASVLRAMVEACCPPVPQPCSLAAQSEKALRVADGLAHLGIALANFAKQAGGQIGAGLAGALALRDHRLELLGDVVERRLDLRRDGLERHLEHEHQRAIGGCLGRGDELVGVDEGEAAGEEVDAAAARLDRGSCSEPRLSCSSGVRTQMLPPE
jgi:hypothetical protein